MKCEVETRKKEQQERLQRILGRLPPSEKYIFLHVFTAVIIFHFSKCSDPTDLEEEDIPFQVRRAGDECIVRGVHVGTEGTG